MSIIVKRVNRQPEPLIIMMKLIPLICRIFIMVIISIRIIINSGFESRIKRIEWISQIFILNLRNLFNL